MKRMGQQVRNGVCQVVCSDRWSIVSNKEEDEYPVCGIKWEDWLKHITIACRRNESQYDRAKGWERVCSTLGDILLRRQSVDESTAVQKRLHVLYYTFISLEFHCWTFPHKVNTKFSWQINVLSIG